MGVHFHQEKGYEQYGTANSTWSFSIGEVEMSEDGGAYVVIEFIGVINLNGTEYSTSRCCGSSSAGYSHQSNLALIKVDGSGEMPWAAVFGHRGDDKVDAVVLRDSGNIEVFYDPIYPPGCASYSQSACNGYQQQSVQITDGTSQGIGYGNEGWPGLDAQGSLAQSARRGRHFEAVALMTMRGPSLERQLSSGASCISLSTSGRTALDGRWERDLRILSLRTKMCNQWRDNNQGPTFTAKRSLWLTSPEPFSQFGFVEVGERLLLHYKIDDDSYALIDNESLFGYPHTLSEWDVNLSGSQLVDVTGCDTWDPDNLVNRSVSGDLRPLLTGCTVGRTSGTSSAETILMSTPRGHQREFDAMSELST